MYTIVLCHIIIYLYTIHIYTHYTYLYIGAVATLATRLLSLNREDFQTVTKVYKSNLYKEVQLMLYSNQIFARMEVDCLLRIASW